MQGTLWLDTNRCIKVAGPSLRKGQQRRRRCEHLGTPPSAQSLLLCPLLSRVEHPKPRGLLFPGEVLGAGYAGAPRQHPGPHSVPAQACGRPWEASRLHAGRQGLHVGVSVACPGLQRGLARSPSSLSGGTGFLCRRGCGCGGPGGPTPAATEPLASALPPAEVLRLMLLMG